MARRPGRGKSGDNARVMGTLRRSSSAPPHRHTAALVATASARGLSTAVALVAMLAGARVALAHGGTVPDAPPDAVSLLFGWSFDPLVILPAVAALLLWRYGVGRVARLHPNRPVATRRTVSWVAGVGVLVFALDSGIERYDTTLFSVHMVQHLLLTLIAPVLLLYAGPITMLLQASSPDTRKRWLLPILLSRVVRVLSFPDVSWLLFAIVMGASHFSPLFDVSLENEWVHRFEHALYLFAALLFWWPVVGPDPSPWRMAPAVKVLYVGLQMPQNTFLALAIYMATTPLYQHYVTTVRSWGPSPLEDQQMAGGIMWLAGDFAFITAVILLVLAWMRDDERRSLTEDRRLEAERSAIREREVALAARRAGEAGEASGRR
jgi:putative copper resistance protein D